MSASHNNFKNININSLKNNSAILGRNSDMKVVLLNDKKLQDTKHQD